MPTPESDWLFEFIGKKTKSVFVLSLTQIQINITKRKKEVYFKLIPRIRKKRNRKSVSLLPRGDTLILYVYEQQCNCYFYGFSAFDH